MAEPWARDPVVLERIVVATIEQHDFTGFETAMKLLALADPRRCRLLLQTVKVGLALAAERDEASAPIDAALSTVHEASVGAA